MKAHVIDCKVLIFCGLVGFIHVFSSFGMSLDEAVRTALARDPAIKQATASIMKAEGFTREVKSDFMPQLAITGEAGWSRRDRDVDGLTTSGEDLFSRRIGLRMRQLLYDFGYSPERLRDARKREEAQELLERAVREVIALETVNAYIDVVTARRQLALARENLKLHQNIGGVAADRSDSSGDQSDVELSAARTELSETLVLERELSLMEANAYFARFVGIEPPSDMRLPRVLTLSKDQIDPMQNFRFLAVSSQYEAALHQRSATARSNRPKIFLEGAVYAGEDVGGIRGADNEASAMIVLNWDIWDSGLTKAKVKQAQGDVDMQAALIDETHQKIIQDIRSVYADYKTQSKRIDVVRQYIEKLKKTGNLYDEQFSLGNRPLLSVLDIRNEEIGARIRLVDEERKHRLLAYQLLALGGGLADHFTGQNAGGKNPVAVAPTK